VQLTLKRDTVVFCHKPMLEGFVRDGEDSTALFNTYISNYHKILDSQPQDLHIGMHLCRGNFKSIGFAEGSYEAIAETLFQKLPIFTYYLEFDTPRAGDFTPLLHLPAGKHVVLGLVSTKFGEIEDFEILKERVLEAASMVAKGTGQTTEMALTSLSVSPQCGFASVWMGNNIVWQDMITKLAMVRKLADEIWPGEL
jgi:methionine synthase II (cobalamin-independent)